MKWSPKQVEALDAVGHWLKHGSNQVFRLFGYAGTGKTTLAKHLAEGLSNVSFAAYTGKAASVMRRNGCDDANTIHRLIYIASDKSRRKLRELEEEIAEARAGHASTAVIAKLARAMQEENDRLKQPSFLLNEESPIRGSQLVIIDECSMVDERMGKDLLSFGVPVLVLGDPAQLPPVRGGGFFTGKKPDIMLNEIHRQARDNPIIDLATRVRNHQSLEVGEYGKSQVMRGTPDRDLVMGADQILVGTNRKRRDCNNQMRKLLGHNQADPMPAEGEKLVCLQNNHDAGLLNGTLWTVDASSELEGQNKYELSLTGEDGEQVACEAHTAHFKGMEKEMPYWELRDAECFDYGYTLTTHKAQGSQWEKVFIFNESGIFRGNSMNWLYTAITRASEEVYICN